MLQKAQKLMVAFLALGAIAAGSAVIANAASDDAGTSGVDAAAQFAASGDSPGQAPQRQDETPLTGETAERVRAAALEEVPGGEIIRLETDAGPAAYEAHVRKPDGSEVVVLVNSDFEVIDVQEGGPGGRPCDRDGDGNPDGGPGSGSGESQGSGFAAPESSSQI